MKLTAHQVMRATLAVSQLIREARPMPQRGKYRLARMHAKLLPEYNPIKERYDALIMEHGVKQTASHEDPTTHEVTVTDTGAWMVPDDQMAAFNAAWAPIGDMEIEIDVQPVPLADLTLGDANGAVEAAELVELGDLVTE